MKKIIHSFCSICSTIGLQLKFELVVQYLSVISFCFKESTGRKPINCVLEEM